MAYDLLIKSGSILNGRGEPPFVADLAIQGDRIAAIGTLASAPTRLVIEASGKYVVPGFVDITNHSDTHLTLFHYPTLDSLIMQGITTILGGNCGASLAPLASREAIQAIRKWADPSQINLNWSTLDEFLTQLESHPPATNFATLVGYGTLRRGVIGGETRALTTEEREKLKLLLKQAMEQGAFGLSLGLSYGHERVSPVNEIIEIAKVVAALAGVVKIHLRSEGSEILASVNEAIRIGREAGVPVQISHLKAIGRKSWSSLPKALELIEHAAASGLDIHFDVSPYHTTGSLLYLLVPAWAREGGFAELFRRSADPSDRKRIMAEIKRHTLHYDRILVVSAKLTSIVGHTLAEVAEHIGLPPEEAILEVLRANEGRVVIVGRTVSQKNTEREVVHAQSLIASDGAGYHQDVQRRGNLVHPRSFGAFPHGWHQLVREKKLLSPEAAIQKMTGLPAAKLGIPKRGSLQEGHFADVVVFDPNLFRDRATHRNPFRFPAGIEWVIVNGVVAVEQGRPTGVRAGKVIRRA